MVLLHGMYLVGVNTDIQLFPNWFF